MLDIGDVNRVTEEAFAEHGTGNVQMPSKIYVTFPHGDFRTMPAYLPAINIAGVKIVNVHPGNRSLGLPSVMALTLILDPGTGVPQALLNATALTDMRTGAAGAVAARHLSRKNEIELGLIGTGRQAEMQLAAIAYELAIRKVKIWRLNEKLAEAFQRAHSGSFDIMVGTPAQACDCDVIVTTTPSRTPIVQNAWIHEGTHINAIGADALGKQELDPALLNRARVFVDDHEQAVHSGEINVAVAKGLFSPDRIAGTLGEVVLGRKGRLSDDEVTIFNSTGLALQDLAIASLAIKQSQPIDIPFIV